MAPTEKPRPSGSDDENASDVASKGSPEPRCSSDACTIRKDWRDALAESAGFCRAPSALVAEAVVSPTLIERQETVCANAVVVDAVAIVNAMNDQDFTKHTVHGT